MVYSRSFLLPASLYFLCTALTVFGQDAGDIVSGTDTQTEETTTDVFVNAWESFSYPLDLFVQKPNTAGDSIRGGTGGVNDSDVNGQGGWTSPWILDATSYQVELSEDQLDTEQIIHQDPFLFPGSFSLIIRTPAINGPKRFFPPVHQGELWISFLYRDTGPAEDHDSGLFVLDEEGTKIALVGKPRDAAVLGISHLPNGASDELTTVSYTETHLLMVRLVMDETGGAEDVFLWVDPSADDRLDTYDAGGQDLLDTGSIGGIMLSRRQDAGSAWFDDICITTVSSLPPAGTVRVDLGFDPASPLRQNADVVLHDVISVDGFNDGFGGVGFGHNAAQDHFLVVRGFIYFTQDGSSRVARGIPVDRMSGLAGFMTAPFNDSFNDPNPIDGVKNALRFHPDSGTNVAVKLDVPPGNYGQCRLLTSGDGSGTLQAVFEYEDGSTLETSFLSPDWLDDKVDDHHGGVISGAITPINNGMNRLDDFSFFEGSDPISGDHPEWDDASFFSDRVSLDRSKTLVSIHLGPSSGSVVNVYDLLLDLQDDVTPVSSWMLY